MRLMYSTKAVGGSFCLDLRAKVTGGGGMLRKIIPAFVPGSGYKNF